MSKSKIIDAFIRYRTMANSYKLSAMPLYRFKAVRRTFITNELKRILVGRSHIKDSSISIDKLTVTGFTFKQNYKLFNEIFSDMSYYFYSGTDNPVIIDCGSNIGMSITFFKHIYPDSRIIAFEPDTDTFNKLESNVKYNNFENVELNQCALADKEGEITFYSDPVHAGSLSMSINQKRMNKGKSTVVPAKLLSSFINKPIDFLKLDVEGAEHLVFDDLTSSGKIDLIQRMAIEYHHHIDNDKDRLSVMLNSLEKHGFGYQIVASQNYPIKENSFQDIMIHAYKK